MSETSSCSLTYLSSDETSSDKAFSDESSSEEIKKQQQQQSPEPMGQDEGKIQEQEQQQQQQPQPQQQSPEPMGKDAAQKCPDKCQCAAKIDDLTDKLLQLVALNHRMLTMIELILKKDD